MLNQFSRTELIFGKEAMEKLANSRIAIFGIGGVGGFTAEALARSGVGTLDLIDDDRVCLTNINRQIFATRKTVGKLKIDVAKERLLEINPDMTINTYKTFYMPETADQFDFTQYDYVVDAIDTVTGKNRTRDERQQVPHADNLLHGRGKQSGSHPLPGSGYLQHFSLPARPRNAL